MKDVFRIYGVKQWYEKCLDTSFSVLVRVE